MGFLMGAFGKLQAGKRMRDIQYRLTTVQRRLRSASRQVADREKYWKSMENSLKNQNTMKFNTYMAGVYKAYGLDNMSAMTIPSGMDINSPEVQDLYNKSMMATQLKTQASTIFTAMSQTSMEQFEMQRDADMQSIKDYEDDLQLEKDSLESQLKIAEADYQSCKDMEKQGAQNLKPDYTGQG